MGGAKAKGKKGAGKKGKGNGKGKSTPKKPIVKGGAEKKKVINKNTFNHAQLSSCPDHVSEQYSREKDVYATSWTETQARIDATVLNIYPEILQHKVDRHERKAAVHVNQAAAELYPDLFHQYTNDKLKEVDVKDIDIAMEYHDEEADAVVDVDETHPTQEEQTTFFDGLKRFRMEWEPTQSVRGAQELPSVTVAGDKRTKVDDQINWLVVLPTHLDRHCQQLMHHNTMQKGLLGLLSLPDTEETRYRLVTSLISDRFQCGTLKKLALGTTPLQCVLTVLRWSVLGVDELPKNRDSIAVPEFCRIHLTQDGLNGDNLCKLYKSGHIESKFVLIMDLLTRILSPNPSLYERALLNTKGKRVLDKGAAVDICLENNIVEVIFKILNDPHEFDINNASIKEFSKARNQMAFLTEAGKNKQNYTAKYWYSAREESVTPEIDKLSNKDARLRKMKEGGYPGFINETTAPCIPEMAICMLRGMTTSYLRQEAAHGVSLTTCIKIIGHSYFPVQVGADLVPANIKHLIRALLSWHTNKGWRVKGETRPMRDHVGAPTRSDAWRVLHIIMVALERCREYISQETYLHAREAIRNVEVTRGKTKVSVSPCLTIIQEWIWFFDRTNFDVLRPSKLSFLKEENGATVTTMLTDSDWFCIVDFACIQLSQLVSGCTDVAVEFAITGGGGTNTILLDFLYKFGHADEAFVTAITRQGCEPVHYLSLRRSASVVWAAIAMHASTAAHRSAVQQMNNTFMSLLNDTHCYAVFNLRGISAAIALLYANDPTTLTGNPEQTTMYCLAEAVRYTVFRYKKNIIDDAHYEKLYLKPEKELMLPQPTGWYRWFQLGCIRGKSKRVVGKKPKRKLMHKTELLPLEGVQAYIAVVDMNGRYIEIRNTVENLQLGGWCLEATRPRSKATKTTSKGHEGDAKAYAKFVFPFGTKMAKIGSQIRVWNPSTNRSYVESERFAGDSADINLRLSQNAQFDPITDFTWLPEADKNVASRFSFGMAGTTRLDDFIDDQQIELVKDFVKDALSADGSKDMLNTMPSLPFSAASMNLGNGFILRNNQSIPQDSVRFAGNPPDGAKAYFEGKLQPVSRWLEHGTQTARTGTQWADPDHFKIGYQGLFLEPVVVFDALHRWGCSPDRTMKLIEYGLVTEIIAILLELYMLREEANGQFHTKTLFDAQDNQRHPDEEGALKLFATLMPPLSAMVRGLYSTVLLQQNVPEPHRFQSADSIWAELLDLYRLLEYFDSSQSSPLGKECAAVAWTNLSFRNNFATNHSMIEKLQHHREHATGVSALDIMMMEQMPVEAQILPPEPKLYYSFEGIQKQATGSEVTVAQAVVNTLRTCIVTPSCLMSQQQRATTTKDKTSRIRVCDECRQSKFPFHQRVTDVGMLNFALGTSETAFCAHEMVYCITTSKIFVAVLNQDYFESEFCRLELRLALLSGVILVPIYPDESSFSIDHVPIEFQEDVRRAGAWTLRNNSQQRQQGQGVTADRLDEVIRHVNNVFAVEFKSHLAENLGAALAYTNAKSDINDNTNVDTNTYVNDGDGEGTTTELAQYTAVTATPMHTIEVTLAKPNDGDYGFTIAEASEGIVVISVDRGGEAWNCGITHTPARIITINQADMTKTSLHVAHEMLKTEDMLVLVVEQPQTGLVETSIELDQTVMVHLTKPESGGYGLSVTESPEGGIFVTGVTEGGEAWKSGMIHPHMRIIELNQVDTTNVSADVVVNTIKSAVHLNMMLEDAFVQTPTPTPLALAGALPVLTHDASISPTLVDGDAVDVVPEKDYDDEPLPDVEDASSEIYFDGVHPTKDDDVLASSLDALTPMRDYASMPSSAVLVASTSATSVPSRDYDAPSTLVYNDNDAIGKDDEAAYSLAATSTSTLSANLKTESDDNLETPRLPKDSSSEFVEEDVHEAMLNAQTAVVGSGLRFATRDSSRDIDLSNNEVTEEALADAPLTNEDPPLIDEDAPLTDEDAPLTDEDTEDTSVLYSMFGTPGDLPASNAMSDPRSQNDTWLAASGQPPATIVGDESEGEAFVVVKVNDGVMLVERASTLPKSASLSSYKPTKPSMDEEWNQTTTLFAAPLQHVEDETSDKDCDDEDAFPAAPVVPVSVPVATTPIRTRVDGTLPPKPPIATKPAFMQKPELPKKPSLVLLWASQGETNTDNADNNNDTAETDDDDDDDDDDDGDDDDDDAVVVDDGVDDGVDDDHDSVHIDRSSAVESSIANAPAGGKPTVPPKKKSLSLFGVSQGDSNTDAGDVLDVEGATEHPSKPQLIKKPSLVLLGSSLGESNTDGDRGVDEVAGFVDGHHDQSTNSIDTPPQPVEGALKTKPTLPPKSPSLNKLFTRTSPNINMGTTKPVDDSASTESLPTFSEPPSTPLVKTPSFFVDGTHRTESSTDDVIDEDDEEVALSAAPTFASPHQSQQQSPLPPPHDFDHSQSRDDEVDEPLPPPPEDDEEVARMLKDVEDEMETAAVRIQSEVRGMKARRKINKMKQHKQQQEPIIPPTSTPPTVTPPHTTPQPVAVLDAPGSEELEENDEDLEQMLKEMEDEMETAVVRIQSGFRGMKARQRINKMKQLKQQQEHHQTTTTPPTTTPPLTTPTTTSDTPQPVASLHAPASEELEENDEDLEQMLKEMEDEMETAVVRIQSGFRGMKARQKFTKMKQVLQDGVSNAPPPPRNNHQHTINRDNEIDDDNDNDSDADGDDDPALEGMLKEMEDELERAVVTIQSGYRGMKARKSVNQLKQQRQQGQDNTESSV